MLLIGDLGNKSLSEKVANHLECSLDYPDLHVFPDGEIRIRILSEVTGKNILVLKSLCPPVNPDKFGVNDNIIEFCFIIDALKRNGAGNVFGIVPYLGYGRADHIFRIGEGDPVEVVIGMLEKTGLDKILLVDPHSIKTPEVFHIPATCESALSLFAEEIKEIEKDNSQISLVSPDMGGIRRVKILSELLGGVSYASVEKERDLETGSIKDLSIKGKANKTCFIVDDMISTGNTIVECFGMLEKEGADNIYVFATHPVFSGDASIKLTNLHVKKVFVTDTITIPEEKKFDKLEILSVAEIIASGIKKFS